MEQQFVILYEKSSFSCIPIVRIVKLIYSFFQKLVYDIQRLFRASKRQLRMTKILDTKDVTILLDTLKSFEEQYRTWSYESD